MARFQERELKAEMQAALLSPWAGRDHGQQGWERRAAAEVQLQHNSRDNEHLSLPCKQDLTHPAQAWGIQQEGQAALGAGVAAGAAAGLAQESSTPHNRGTPGSASPARCQGWGWQGEPQGPCNRGIVVWLHTVSPWFLLEAELFLSSSEPGDS